MGEAAVLAEVYDAVTACVRDLDEDGLAPPDTDAVSYWRGWNPSAGDGGAAHAAFVRAAAAAYSSPRVVVEQWTETAAAAGRAARFAPVDDVVATQGHRLALPDFLSTLLVEGAVHLLDLTAHVAGPPVPATALAEVRRVLVGLLGGSAPDHWDDVELALKGTGRLPLSDADREALGESASRFPLLG